MEGGGSEIDVCKIEDVNQEEVAGVAREIVPEIHLSPDIVGVEGVSIGKRHPLAKIESIG